MTNFARIINETAVDVSTDPTNQFHPDIAREFVTVPDEVKHGWYRDADNHWHEPEPIPAPEPTPPEPTVPEEVTMRQARLYLHQAGLLEQVDALVKTLDQAAQIEWGYASIVERHSKLLASLADHLELEKEAVDLMFAEASKL